MKFIHTAFLLLLAATFVQSQSLQVGPALGNPVLKSHAAQKAVQDARLVEQLTGFNPLVSAGEERSAPCPPSLDGNFVESGSSIQVKLDTFGLMNGLDPATLTVLNANALLFGTLTFDDTTLFINYTATAGLTSNQANVDVVQIKLSQPGHDTIVEVEFFVRRQGRVVFAPTQTVQPESITTFCLDDELVFELPLSCASSRDIDEGYDGRGYAYHHLRTYDFPDTCLVYYASRFPGIDTFSMTLCDDWGVCDVFMVPYIIPGDTLSIQTLPFFDDFSSYSGKYPTADLWLDNSVYRNDTYAKNPPSVGMVTFDGLNQLGDVYPTFNGVGDRLTSKAIDLSGFNANSDVFLRFYLAPKGFGLPPAVVDKMTLEFRNNSREWVTVGTYDGLDNVSLDSFPPFLFYAIKVDDAQFFHDAFQFRFSAIVSPGGVVDLWHLDYIRLSRNEGNPIEDVAITQLPSSLLRNYTAMPLYQLKEDVSGELNLTLASQFFNHFDDVLAIADSRVLFKEITTGSALNTGILPVIEGGSESNLSPLLHEDRTRSVPGNVIDELSAKIEGIQDGNLRVLQTQYSIRPSSQENFYLSNDTVRINNVLSDYYAHDDGTAEWQLFIRSAQGGEQYASKFHAYEADTVHAVQLMFPHVNGDVTDQLFNLKVWVGSLDSEPVVYRQLLTPFYPNLVYDTLQGFTTYLLDDFGGNPTPAAIPANTDFYIGFEQETASAYGIPLGFDIQNPCQCNWVKLKEQDPWTLLPFDGAIAMRPVMKKTRSTSASNEVSIPAFQVQFYPNPTTGQLNISLATGNFDDFEYAIFNNLGQRVGQGTLLQSLDLSSLSNGIYSVQVVNPKTGEQLAKRIVLVKD